MKPITYVPQIKTHIFYVQFVVLINSSSEFMFYRTIVVYFFLKMYQLNDIFFHQCSSIKN